MSDSWFLRIRVLICSSYLKESWWSLSAYSSSLSCISSLKSSIWWFTSWLGNVILYANGPSLRRIIIFSVIPILNCKCSFPIWVCESHSAWKWLWHPTPCGHYWFAIGVGMCVITQCANHWRHGNPTFRGWIQLYDWFGSQW